MNLRRFVRPALMVLCAGLLLTGYLMPSYQAGVDSPADADSPVGAEPLEEADSLEMAEYGSFVIRDDVTVPGPPDAVFDRFTRVGEWWDHSFSEAPIRFNLEPKPGGGFWEIFDEEGNGVLHATVIYAHRGRVLRFDGPLGLSGNALKMVHTLEFTPVGDSTRVTLDLHASGEIQDGWTDAVQGAWHHFLTERFKPYVEGRLEGA